MRDGRLLLELEGLGLELGQRARRDGVALGVLGVEGLGAGDDVLDVDLAVGQSADRRVVGVGPLDLRCGVVDVVAARGRRAGGRRGSRASKGDSS